MIYAKVDVKLRDHERAHRAGAAMATWTWALLYVREQESDGYMPDVALRGSWVGEKEAIRHAAKLVEVGLWEATDGGWRICRYAEKNETRAAIETRRAEARERMGRVRANKQRTPSEPPESEQPAVPGYGYGSGVGLVSSGGAGGAAPPAWFGEAVKTAEQAGCPVPEADLPARWVQFQGSMARRSLAPTQQAAASWLVSTIRSERSKAASQTTAPPRSSRQPHDTGWLDRMKQTGTGGDL